MAESPTSTAVVGASLEDNITLTACKMLEDGARGRQTRFEQIKKNEDQYFGVLGPALKGRSNIPFDSVVMGGFIDTLLANTRQSVSIGMEPTREQDYMAAKKVSAVAAREMAPDKGAWDDKIQDTKLMAALSGVGFNKIYVEGAPKFKTDLFTCDHYDMIIEPMGGGYLDKHLYKFQMNLFRTRLDLTDGVTNGYYNKVQVAKLVRGYDEAQNKKATDIFNNKSIRYASFGIDIATMGYVGQTIYRLTEGVVNYNGKWYYILFSYETKIWVRCQPLEEVFEHAKEFPGRGPWTMWQTHRHPFIAWTKAPADDVRPIAYSMKKVVNYTMDNLEKKNWGQRAYDPRVFTNPVDLLWKQDGLVRATVKPGQQIANGIFEFQTPDTASISINLTEWLNNFLGQKTGINNEAQGGAGTANDTVGIAVQNLQQSSKRMMLANDMFKKSLVDLGTMLDYGIYEHLREPYAVKILGPKGTRWEEEVTHQDAEREFTITVKSGDEEEQRNTIAAAKRSQGFAELEKNPAAMAKINQSEYLRLKFKDMGFDDEESRVLLDVNNDGDQESRAHAAQAIQDCIEGKPMYKLYRGATAGFIQKILDFCADNYDLVPPDELAKMSKSQKAAYKKDMEEHDKLLAYAMKHIPIAQQNMIRAATAIVASKLAAPAPVDPAAAPAKPAIPLDPNAAPAPVA